MTSRATQPDTDADRQLRECLDATPLRSFIMVAGAGSGKTTSLVKALDHIRKSRGEKLRRHGQRIACITYTVVAAEEVALDVGDDHLFHVSTIHSFLWTAIRPFQDDIRIWIGRRLEEKIASRQATIENPKTRQEKRQNAEEDIKRYRKQMTVLPRVANFTYGTGSNYAKGVLGHSDVLKMVPEILQEKPLLRSVVAQRFPFVFVDESQDTDQRVVAALRAIARQHSGTFCLGFFGDPMQQIYATGIGPIAPDSGWESITKRENFRCPQAVLSVINNIRAAGDRIQQQRGRTSVQDGVAVPVIGTARFHVLPADDKRIERLDSVRGRYRTEAAEKRSGHAGSTERVLVLVHRIAAQRLGFGDLFSAMYDKSPDDLKTSFVEGTAWPLRPFLSYLLPLTEAFAAGNDFEVMNLLRKHCPLLDVDALPDANFAARLTGIKEAIETLRKQLHEGNASIREVLTHVAASKLATLDERLLSYILDTGSDDELGTHDEANEEADVMTAYLSCVATQTRGYRKYIESESPFATQQGVKGAEFSRVFVVIDDEEGKEHNQFSYEKYFGTKPLSDTDQKNIAAGKDDVLSRTRRLFYVCCSRALEDLVVVWFTKDVDAASKAIEQMKLFPAHEVIQN